MAPPLVAVVDDDPSVRRALSRLLCSAGLQVALFSSAADFLESEMTRSPSCLVLDIHLGGMSGLELLNRVRAEGRAVPALIITAHDDPQTRELAARSGCSAYLRKPFEASEFLQGIFRMIEWEKSLP